MSKEAIQTFVRQLKESTAYKDHVGVRTIVDETVGRIAVLPEEGSGEMLREEIHGLHERIAQLLHGSGAPKKKEKKGKSISPQEAASVIGSDHFFGLESVQSTFPGIIKLKDLPPIQFSRADLQRAKELGHSLRLRIGQMSDGTGLTMKRMHTQLQDAFDQAGNGKILYDTSWYESEQFFAADTPALSWVLTSDDVLPDSAGKDYLQQTELIAGYLKDTVYQGNTLPQQYADAIRELDAEKEQIRALIDNNDWQQAAEKLADLKLNQLTRRVPADVLYDLIVTFQKNGQRNLEGMYDWTCVRSSDGDLVGVGSFDAEGALVVDDRPGRSSGHLGVVLSRKF